MTLQRKIGSVSLLPHEVEEMEKLGMTNPSQYMAYKLRGTKPAVIQLEPSNSEVVKPASSPSLGSSVEDAIKIAKLESQNEQLLQSLQSIKSQQEQGLGALEMQMSERMEKFMRERELHDLKRERDDYKSKLEDSERKFRELEDSHNKAQNKLGTMEMVKEFAPMLQPVLAGLGKGLVAAKEHGLAGLLSGFGNEPEDPAKIEADEIAGYLVDLFSSSERETIKQIIGTFHEDKALIARTVTFLQRLAQAKVERMLQFQTLQNQQAAPVQNDLVPDDNISSDNDTDEGDDFDPDQDEY